MNIKKMDFRKIIVLIYLNNQGAISDINELLELLGINYNLAKKFIYELLCQGLIVRQTGLIVYSLSSLGKQYLYNQYLQNISLEELKAAKGADSTKISKIYIPKDFKKRFI